MEMLCDTLSVIASGETAPTRVMYHANMSWIETKALSEDLDRTRTGRGKEPTRNASTYSLTEKGFELVRTFNNIRRGSKHSSNSLVTSDLSGWIVTLCFASRNILFDFLSQSRGFELESITMEIHHEFSPCIRSAERKHSRAVSLQSAASRGHEQRQRTPAGYSAPRNAQPAPPKATDWVRTPEEHQGFLQPRN